MRNVYSASLIDNDNIRNNMKAYVIQTHASKSSRRVVRRCTSNSINNQQSHETVYSN